MSSMITDTTAEVARRHTSNTLQGVARVNLEDAACRYEDLGMFFAGDEEGEKQAKTVCRRCPVRWECLTYALETRQRYGVWGGLTAEERAVLIRKLRSEVPQ